MKISKDFLRNSGHWVFLSSSLGKVFAFAMTLYLVKTLSSVDFGILTIAINLIGFFIPAIGFGANHGLLRFGSMVSAETKTKLIGYAHYRGFINQIILSVFLAIIIYWYAKDNSLVLSYTLVMLVRLFGLLFLEQAKAELRASFLNEKFARLEIISNFSAMFLGIIFTFVWGAWGYIASLCLFPYLVFFIHRFRFYTAEIPKKLKRLFWRFSLQSVITLVIFIWIFLLDVFFVGKYFSNEDVGFYKICTLIPMNLIIFAQVYTQTFYPELCKNHKNKRYIRKFIRNYYLLFIPIVLLLLSFGLFFGKPILQFFSEDFTETKIQDIMFFQMASCMLLRIPFGNLIGAMGHITASLVLGIFMVLGISLSCILLLPKTENMAIAAYISLFFITLGGFGSAIYFFIIYKNLKR
ncbi:MAG: hypothetical protein Q4G16_08900 [Cruoricaptor ignavus]|nr:hypothetical protein [Cruoricaptor ignavus]